MWRGSAALTWEKAALDMPITNYYTAQKHCMRDISLILLLTFVDFKVKICEDVQQWLPLVDRDVYDIDIHTEHQRLYKYKTY